MNKDYSFREEMAINVKWVGFAQFFDYIFQFIIWIVLARILSPNSFGALGVAIAFSNSVLMFNEWGMSSALIQRRDSTEKHKVTTFWVAVITGLFFSVITASFSGLIANFFKDSSIAFLIIVFALKIMVDSFGIVHEALLKKELVFKKLTLIELFTSLIFGVLTIYLVFRGYGVISIAWGYLTKSIIRTIFLWKICPFRPNFEFDKKSFFDFFQFGKNLVGFKVLSYFTGFVDVILIGKLLGVASLGYYSMTLKWINFPREKLSAILSKVAFPAFSKIQEHTKDLRNAYLKMVRYASVINFPLLIGLILIAPQFIRIIYTSKWVEMVLPLQIMCIYGTTFSITTFVGIVFISTGHPEYSFKLSIITFFGAIAAILCGIKFGLSGVTIALSTYAVIINIIGNLWVKHLIKMDFFIYLSSMFPAVISSAMMLLAILLFFRLQRIISFFPEVLFLVLTIIFGAFIYVLSLFLVSRKTFREMMHIAQKMIVL
jgi:O-antigen/teichoic acid export membrane protein